MSASVEPPAPRSAPGPSSRTRAFIALVVGGVITGALALALAGRASGGDAALFLGRFHSVAVHLPIGLILLLALLELATLRPTWRASITPALPFVMLLALGSAIAAAVLGTLLASEGGLPRDTLSMHRSLMLATIVSLAATCAVAWWRGDRARAPYRVMLTITCAVLVAGAHQGGNLVHGAGYLFRYAPSVVQRLAGYAPPAPRTAPAVPPDVTATGPLLFADVVQPLLVERCGKCHGGDKHKGGFSVDGHAALLAGGDEGPAVVPSKPDESPLLQRIGAPIDDSDHMPPDDEPQLSPAEVQLLRLWVERGASDRAPVTEFLPPAGVRALLEAHTTR